MGHIELRDGQYLVHLEVLVTESQRQRTIPCSGEDAPLEAAGWLVELAETVSGLTVADISTSEPHSVLRGVQRRPLRFSVFRPGAGLPDTVRRAQELHGVMQEMASQDWEEARQNAVVDYD